MRCEEFKKDFDKYEISDLPPQMLEHADGCKECRHLLEIQRNIDKSMMILNRCTPKLDFTSRIMTAIRSEEPGKESGNTLTDKIWKWFVPAPAFRLSMVIGAILVLAVIILPQLLLKSPADFPGSNISEEHWEMAFLNDPSGFAAKAWNGKTSGILLPNGNSVDFPEGTKVVLNLPGKAEAVVADGFVIPQESGFYLKGGVAELKVHKRKKTDPFVIATPYADVVVVGTSFRLDLHGDNLKVKVTEGRVRVVNPDGAYEVGLNEELVVGAKGFLEIPTSDRNGTSSTHLGRTSRASNGSETLGELESPGK